MSGRFLAGFLAVLLLMIAGAAEPTRVVQAEEILKKIELGQPVEYDNVIVAGDLNLNGLDLPKASVKRTWDEKNLWDLTDYEAMIASPIVFTNSVIKGSVNFNGTNFQNTTDFYNTRFEGHIYLLGSRFNHTADFRMVQFNREAYFGSAEFRQYTDFWDAKFNQTDFSYAQFNQGVNFLGAQFSQNVSFSYAQFNQRSCFESTKFNQEAGYINAQFNQVTSFRDAQFNQTAGFWIARFEKEVSFGGARFNQDSEFLDVRFNSTAGFRSTQFNGDAGFMGTEFNQTANFRDAKFNQESSFLDASFLDVFFNNSQFSKEAFFQGAQISGTLSLYRTKYNTLNIRWSSIHDLAYDDTAYHLLIQNFNKLGFGDDASECQYSYRCKHREEIFRQHKFDSWLFDLLAWASYGYGLRPVRPLGWAALFMLMGGLFFFLTGSVARSKESTDPAENSRAATGASQNKPEGNVSIWEALLLSATYFTSGASSIISATPTEFVPLGRGRYVVVILRLLGWIFFVLFLSTLTGTV